MNAILFKIKAQIGKTLTQSFYKKTGRNLNVGIHLHKGSVNIEWSSIGDNTKPKLMFLHGFSDQKENFYFAARTLRKHFDLIIPDMPGFGNSTTDSHLIYSLENYETWLGEFIENNHFTQFHLAGNSLGGAVSTKLAVRYPERITSLILVDPAGFYIPGVPSIYDEALNGINLFQIGTADEYADFQGRIFHNKPKLPGCVKEFMVDRAISHQAWYAKVFNELTDLEPVRKGVKTLEELSLNSLCAHIQMPTMILWGRHDTLFPCKTGELLKKEIPEAALTVFDNVGHCPHLENPKAFSQQLIRFIKQPRENRLS